MSIAVFDSGGHLAAHVGIDKMARERRHRHQKVSYALFGSVASRFQPTASDVLANPACITT